MPNFDYTMRDFPTIRGELIDRAGVSIPEWTDRNPSDFMMGLIDLWAYAADVLHYYIDRTAGEAFLPTATQRESVVALANLYDYTPNPITSSVATLTVFNSTSASVTIPAKTVFTGQSNGKTFAFYNTGAIAVNATAANTFTVREGVLYADQSVTSSSGKTVSDGTPSQRFSLFHKNVDPATVTVDVYEGTGNTAVRWRRVGRLVNTAAVDSVYSVYTMANGTVQIVFGDGINGRIPPVNMSIKVGYAVSSGADGNIPENSITTLNTASLPGLRITSSSAAGGGTSPETMDSMKLNLPKTFRTANRAVTLEDFTDLALGVSGVSKATSTYAVGPSGNGGSVTVYAVPYQSSYTTAASTTTTISVEANLRETVALELMGSAMLGVASVAVPSTIQLTNIFFEVDIYVKDSYVQTWIKSDVEAAIDTLFKFDRMTFGQTLTIGEFYRVILAVEGVDYAVIKGFNTTGYGNGLSSSGKITVDQYKLPKKGGVAVTSYGGLTPPNT